MGAGHANAFSDSMRIEDSNGREIQNLDEWSMIYDKNGEKPQWQPGRSAHSVAEFVLNRNGVERFEQRVREVLGQSVKFDRMVPEYEQRFDAYGRGRMHDLGIFGTTEPGQSLFVGVEAKVDETFGATVGDSYLKAKAKQIAGTPTNAPQRIEELLGLHFAKPDVSMFDLRYQLLYATVGTLAAGADVSVLYVAVFKTPSYDAAIGASNYDDYLRFIEKIGGQPLSPGGEGVIAHEVTLDGKRLVCVHEYFDMIGK